MKFKNLQNKDIVEVIDYIGQITNNPLCINNTMISIIELNDIINYKVNTEKTLTIIDKEYGESDIPLNDKDLIIYSEDDMLIIVYSFSEIEGYDNFNVILFRIEENILSDIMKIIKLEREGK